MNPEVHGENEVVTSSNSVGTNEVTNTGAIPVVTNPVPTVTSENSNTGAVPVVDNTMPTVIDPSKYSNGGPVAPVVTSPSITPTIPVEMKEKPKKEIEYKPIGKVKGFFLVLFFVVLIAFVIFLPQVSTFITKLMRHEIYVEEEIIETGKLICSEQKTLARLDKEYDLTFAFEENQLKSMVFKISTRGDVTLDEKELEDLTATCKQLEENLESVSGATVRCDYSGGKLVELQTIELENIDFDELRSAYTKAGEKTPEYQYNQDISFIEKSMNASGYSCERQKN